MKLELKHLAAYFPYQLKVLDIEKKDIYEAMCLYEDTVALYSETMPTISYYLDGTTQYLKPILRPLSDIHKSIDGVVPANFLYREYDLTDMEFNGGTTNPKWGYEAYQYLISYHFDVFGLIDNVLAVDYNTLSH